MKPASLLVVFLAGGIFLAALAQVPQGTSLRRSTMPSYRHTAEGNKLDFVITGSTVSNLSAHTLLVNQFELTSFRNGDQRQTNIIAQAPQCEVDVSNNVASDAGPVQISTPATNILIEGVRLVPVTNLLVRGVGFIFTQSNHFLIISNKVETQVVKSMLKSSILAAPRTNASADVSRVFIFADHGEFNFDSNVVDYAGNVHLIDPQLDLTSDLLTIRFTTNGAVESILARQNVVLTTTNNGRATGATGFYYVVNGNEMMRLTTDAAWRNGDEEAKADEFDYDSARHFLTLTNHVKVRWPNAGPNPLGGATNPTPLLAGTNGFRELFADFATVQFPPTNGPVEEMHARGNVLILNQGDQSSAMAEQADYEKRTDRVDLTGNPVWWNTNMEVKADTLSAELGAKVYHARTNARFKMRTGSGATNQTAAASGHSTNQWLFIAADAIEYQTNLAMFYRNVETRLVENDQLQDSLNCALLTLNLASNKVESAFAFGNVHGETAPDAAGVVKTIACEQLNAFLSTTTGLMKNIEAYTNVVIEEKGSGPAAPRNKLAADTVTAQFSAVTNQIERAVAERNVVLDQVKAGKTTHATARRGVYTSANDQVLLTGEPLAHSDDYVITDADFMVWQPKANQFGAFGQYKIVPIKPAAGRKPL
jgi:lipopolysaccharide export system protein LptA